MDEDQIEIRILEESPYQCRFLIYGPPRQSEVSVVLISDLNKKSKQCPIPLRPIGISFDLLNEMEENSKRRLYTSKVVY
jgi:hypothetical protein